MKSLNIKKLAAIAAGIALAGIAIAPIVTAAASDITKSDLINTDGTPGVDIVVGKKAKASDIVWAGNIAAALAQKAYINSTVSTSVTGGGTVPSVEGLTVDLTVGGTVSVSGGKTFYNNMYSGITTGSGVQETNFGGQLVTNSSIPSLKYYGNKSYTWDSVSYTTTIQERLGFTADVFYDFQTEKAMMAEVLAGNLKYNLNLGSGIPKCVSATAPTCGIFNDDSNDNIRIPFLGEEYLVNKNDSVNGLVELLKTSGEKQYSAGDKITDLVGKDGTSKYYLEVVNGLTFGSTNKITLKLYKEDGTYVDGGNYEAGDVVFYDPDTGNTVLQSLVYIKDIGTRTENNTTIYVTTVLVGNSRVQLYDGKGYPYDSTSTSSTWDYTVALGWGSSSDVNKLTDINIITTVNKKYSGTTALRSGQSGDFPADLGKLKFLGLQLPEFSGNGVSKTERTTGIEFKTSATAPNGALYYKDSTYEATHEVPFYVYFTSSDNAYGTFTFDTKTIWYRIRHGTTAYDRNVTYQATAAGALATGVLSQCIGDGNYINGMKVDLNNIAGAGVGFTIGGVDHNVGDLNVDLNGMLFKFSGIGPSMSKLATCVYLSADGNISFRKDSESGTLIQEYWFSDGNITGNAAMSAPVTFEGASSVTANYIPSIDTIGTSSRIWLLLDGDQNFTAQYSKKIGFIGTDLGEAGDTQASLHLGTALTRHGVLGSGGGMQFYVPHSALFQAWGEGDTNYSAAEYLVAQFKIDEDELIDTTTDTWDMNVFIDTGTGKLVTPVSCNTNISRYNNEADWNGGLYKKMSECAALTTSPKEVFTDFGSHITLSNGTYKAVIPENRPQAEIQILGTGTTTTTSGGEAFTGKAKGDMITTTGGTTVTIDDIKYSNATCTGEGGAALCTATPSTYKAMGSIPTDFVKLDSDAGTGAHIIMGGWKVNSLAKDIVGLQDSLTKKGDYVVDKDGDNVIVAGYTAADTMTAAQALITQIDSFS